MFRNIIDPGAYFYIGVLYGFLDFYLNQYRIIKKESLKFKTQTLLLTQVFGLYQGIQIILGK